MGQGMVKDGGYGGEFAGDAGGLHFLQAAVAPFSKVVRHDFGGFNIANGVAQKAGKAYVFAAAASFGGGDFGAVSADDVADGLILWCDAKGAAGDFGFGLCCPCLCFGGRAKCFGADVATQAHADKVLAVSFGDAGHDVDLKKRMVYLKIHHPSGFYKVIGVRLVHSYFKLLMLNIILVPTARLELAQPKATTPSR